MEQFIDYENLKESILIYGNLANLVKQAMQKHKVSASYVYKLWSILCIFGLTKTSLRTRFDKCGAPGIRRELSPNNIRKKQVEKPTLNDYPINCSVVGVNQYNQE